MNKIDDFDMNAVRITNYSALFITHTIGLLLKRVRYFKRDLRSLCCEILLPCIIVLVGLSLMTITFIKDGPEIEITAKNFPWTTTRVYWTGDTNGA
jgi:ATP-binding cassette subfamily A (ABC1) protein 3